MVVTKPGWKTTEFWIALVPVIALTLRLLGIDVGEEEISGLVYAAAGFIGAAYVIGRAVVKVFRVKNARNVVDPAVVKLTEDLPAPGAKPASARHIAVD